MGKNKGNGAKEKQGCEQGRSLLETLGVLAIMVCLTLGGLQFFKWAQQQAVGKNLMKQVLSAAIVRQNSFLGLLPKKTRPDRERHMVGDIPIVVENGVSGAEVDFFFVSVGDADKKISRSICEDLLKEKSQLKKTTLQLVDINVNDIAGQECDEENKVTFLFAKHPKAHGNTDALYITPHEENPDDPDHPTICERRRCPEGAICADGQLTACKAGYHMENCGTCNVTCAKCPKGEYTSKASASCEEGCIECEDKEHKTNINQTACVCADGYITDSNGRCVECVNDSNCKGEGLKCKDYMCQRDCGKDRWVPPDQQCPECWGPDDCGDCQECSAETSRCESVCQEGETCVNNKCQPKGGSSSCDPNATLVENVCLCNAGYWGDGQTCTACGNNFKSSVGSTEASACFCPDNHYVTENKNCLPCATGATSTGPNATSCTISCQLPEDCWPYQKTCEDGVCVSCEEAFPDKVAYFDTETQSCKTMNICVKPLLDAGFKIEQLSEACGTDFFEDLGFWNLMPSCGIKITTDQVSSITSDIQTSCALSFNHGILVEKGSTLSAPGIFTNGVGAIYGTITSPSTDPAADWLAIGSTGYIYIAGELSASAIELVAPYLSISGRFSTSKDALFPSRIKIKQNNANDGLQIRNTNDVQLGEVYIERAFNNEEILRGGPAVFIDNSEVSMREMHFTGDYADTSTDYPLAISNSVVTISDTIDFAGEYKLSGSPGSHYRLPAAYIDSSTVTVGSMTFPSLDLLDNSSLTCTGTLTINNAGDKSDSSRCITNAIAEDFAPAIRLSNSSIHAHQILATTACQDSAVAMDDNTEIIANEVQAVGGNWGIRMVGSGNQIQANYLGATGTRAGIYSDGGTITANTWSSNTYASCKPYCCYDPYLKNGATINGYTPHSCDRNTYIKTCKVSSTCTD